MSVTDIATKTFKTILGVLMGVVGVIATIIFVGGSTIYIVASLLWGIKCN